MKENPQNSWVEGARPRRWDVPFGPDMTEEAVDRILAIPTFARIQADAFPPSTPLRGIIRNDARVVRFENGDIIVREGDYGNSAFFVLEGTVHAVLGGLPESLLGRSHPQRRSLLRALAQFWKSSRVPEFSARTQDSFKVQLGTRRDEGQTPRVFLHGVPEALNQYRTVPIREGEFFGELAALGRSPRTATVVAEGDVELLEIRWQGIRDVRRRCGEIRAQLDQLYRDHGLEAELRESPLLQHLTPEELKEVADQTVFETYGSVDWQAALEPEPFGDEGRRFPGEPIIAEQGHIPNGLLLVRAGFVRVTERVGAGERTVGYLGRGQSYGMKAFARGGDRGSLAGLDHTLRALGYVDILRIPAPVVQSLLLPSLLGARGAVRRTGLGLEIGTIGASGVDPAFLEFLGERRIINGTAAMIIDLKRCVRCDDCVCACAAGHGGNPRFVRQGPRFGRRMIATACMHCVDPLCLIGCPTGAIHRFEAGGQVLINDRTCTGCGTCAESCPYRNILLVVVRNERGDLIYDRDTHLPVRKATKCDLCVEQLGGPACARACPHDALRRADLRDLQALFRWLEP
jgi:Fe-S-cluster-containing dehydrogenase component/CRP-like cAMP-binding protein